MKQNISPRGQAFTLEAIFASLIMLSAVVFALQATAITPLTVSTSSQQVQNQQAAVADGFLSTVNQRGDIEPAILYWDDEANRWHESGVTRAYSSGPPNAFGQQLNQSFRDWGIATNVYVYYHSEPNAAGDRYRHRHTMVDMGVPSTHAVSSQKTVVLYEEDVIYDENSNPTSTTLKEIENDGDKDFYAPNAAPDSEIYNVVTIKVVVWRI